ncbi:MAG: MlaE family lipid ABC transporter permease subunit [Spartobacteria bacterium]|nr:MlaE family lipid ABC transporter permease subunit [Spartobacteria bacterium]
MTEQEKQTRILELKQQDGALTLVMAGPWRFQDNLPDLAEMGKTFQSVPGLNEVRFRDAGISTWDSGCLTFILNTARLCEDAGIACVYDGLPDGIQSLLALASAIPERVGARRVARKTSFLARVGNAALNAVKDAYESVYFLGEAVMAFGNMLRGRARFRMQDLWAIIQECGPEALPIVTVISVLVGMILSFLGSVQLKLFGAEIYIADLVGIGMVREMGALMTGIIMAGRTGASFAARLGTMQVNEEIDALKTMGFSPMEFLVLPRMLALILMMPLLTIYADVLGILGGAVIGITMLDLTPTQYYMQTTGAVTLQAVSSGLIKGALFGVLVAISGCMQGIRCGRSASAVGDATTTAVVNAIVYIIVCDSILSIIFTLTGF